MLNEFLRKSVVCRIKEKGAENRKEWRTLKPRTCLMAEH